ncbi:hypothetical protein [Prosthecobacter sp.]|uniref:hypothetical protein n=1 Tax=Prosthecobacter sp. TaxID=1965333 RepID=UPI002ABC430E|nr:hypothetical protein [Prosthecobacter sp.]MDZ4404817.1 hypothetical protein [Prosthecobacter sp.]
MNRIYRLILLSCLICTIMAPCLHAQEAVVGEEGEKRVQYQLVLPDEKTPENVKPEEHNPFESESEAQNRLAPGDTEENRVRDKLLKLPVVGTKRMQDGRMRVLLGNIILETGGVVPPVLPEQLVELKVKNITSQYIELAWQEKRATGLPPKLMIIPINISPKVRYQMLGQTEEEGQNTKGANATMDLPLHDLESRQQNAPPATPAAEPQPLRAEAVPEDPIPATTPPQPQTVKGPVTPPPVQAAAPQKPVETPPPAAPPPSPAVESVVRMLFGNPTPAPK